LGANWDFFLGYSGGILRGNRELGGKESGMDLGGDLSRFGVRIPVNAGSWIRMIHYLMFFVFYK
jgi:hypothetical protein